MPRTVIIKRVLGYIACIIFLAAVAAVAYKPSRDYLLEKLVEFAKSPEFEEWLQHTLDELIGKAMQ